MLWGESPDEGPWVAFGMRIKVLTRDELGDYGLRWSLSSTAAGWDVIHRFRVKTWLVASGGMVMVMVEWGSGGRRSFLDL